MPSSTTAPEMAKRVSSGADGAPAPRKRHKTAHEAPPGEKVLSSQHLRKLLAFDQDLRRARHGLQSFKKLLDDATPANGDGKEKLAILQEYLEAVKPRDAGDEAVYLADIMDMWSFAARVNDEGVMSSVAVVLALVLRAVSESLQLVPHGLGVCQTLLLETQLKSLSRNLSSDKGKAFVISPTLRLLREAVCLDGGAFAKRIVRARAYTFASLGRNMELGHVGDGHQDTRKASVRTNAVRFFLSCLRYLHSQGRKELLSQRELVSHLTYMIKTDPPHLVLDILDTLKSHVLMDTKIPREVKLRSFNTKTLSRFLALYSYTSPAGDADEKEIVSERAHQFLVYLCTTPGAGVLYPYKGLYPKESDDESSTKGHGGDPWAGRLRDRVPVFNFVLSEFAGKLRPWSSLRHSELLVAMFTAAPELVADYFYNNRSFSFEPKLSMTWIGYAAFLFNTMVIPLPASFGDPARYASLPPPTSVLLDNIIPPAVNQKVLMRCLSPKSHLTSFFATRILVAALEKLATAVDMHGSSASRPGGSTWSEAARRLVDAFCQRIPDMKEIVRCYKGIPAENSLHRTLASRLLRLYYQVIPRVALAANFDVSPLVVDVLGRLQRHDHQPGTKALGVMELENLVAIASYSPGMRWFSKMESLGDDGTPSSAFTALLRLLCGGDGDAPHRQLRDVLAGVAVENQLVSRTAGLRPLLRTLHVTVDQLGAKDTEAVWGFLDSCLNRCATSPIRYLDQMEALAADGSPAPVDRLSLLTLVLAEQLPYATGAGEERVAGPLARFLSLYFNACHVWEASSALLAALHQRVGDHLSSAKAGLASLGDADDVEALTAANLDTCGGDGPAEQPADGDGCLLDGSRLREMLHAPFAHDADTAALTKWTSKRAEDWVEDGWAAGLVGLLSSEHTNIRKEAVTNIRKMAAQMRDSPYEEKTQTWLLLSELAESSKAQVELGPVPSALTAFTAHALDVLRSPLHPLYPKVNSFLTRSPVWSLEKLPLAHDILHGEPSGDDKYYTELAWLLAYLLDGLRTPSDLAVFRKKKWFEKILALASNPYLRSGLRTRVLRIIYRATCIDGGSTTLVTRFGVLGWLDAQRAACGGGGDEAAVCRALTRRVWETCDQQCVAAWSSRGVESLVDGVVHPVHVH